MSFPPRPPMGMPPMGPGGMMPQSYGYGPPMGMMPMGMRMMPPMMRPNNMGGMSTNNVANRAKKLVPQEIPKKENSDEKLPVTTVFVGNISERAPDAMIRQMLQRCGNVLSWKRVQGASGKLQAFGFCEYEDPEATLRCIRLLNEWHIVDKPLVVKVDAKTKALLDDYKKKKRQRLGLAKKKDDKDESKEDSEKEQGEIDDEERPSDDEGEEEDEVDEDSQREDRVAKAGLDAIMREYSEELAKEPPPEISIEEKREKRREKKEKEKIDREAGLDDMELEGEKLDLINREIKSFRDAHKDDDQRSRELEREREREARRHREEEWERERETLREREREREREAERKREMKYIRSLNASSSAARAEQDREREREREREMKRRERDYRRSRSRSRDRERDRRDRDRGHSMSRERDRDRDRMMEDEEEVYERRKLERKIREKEASYQEILKKWEARERKRARDYEKERDREDDRKEEEAVEARRLKKFLEDYDDEQDDPKYYKGSALQRRLKEREKEMEMDERDRQREKEELEEIRKKLEEESHPDIEAEMARIEKERDEHLMPRLQQFSPEPSGSEHDDKEDVSPEVVMEEEEDEPHSETRYERRQQQPMMATNTQMMKQQEPPASMSSRSSYQSDSDNDNDDHGIVLPPPVSEDSLSYAHSQSNSLPGIPSREDSQQSRVGFSGIKLASSESPEPQKRKKMTIGEVFNQDEEEEAPMKKHRLIPLVYSDEEKAAIITPSKPTTAEEKRKCIKNLIEKIPTGKNELFAFKLDWSMVDQMLMDRRIKPWVNKKIVEYIGEEEATLTEFICQKVMTHSSPAHILNDVAMVLDEEAEVFVVKMWRLLIYETEAKKLGLVK